VPILDVEMVGGAGAKGATLSRRIADAAGKALGAPEGQTWVRLRTLSPSAYAESGGTPKGVRPVFVSVLLQNPPRGKALAEHAKVLTRAIAAECGRPPQNVHLLYRASARGRASFGGRLLA
jgi:phenylpyruvate tautomerase PptA (4-oxalocrotonate tautomerase family)